MSCRHSSQALQHRLDQRRQRNCTRRLAGPGRRQFALQRQQFAALVAEQLAADQVERLDAIGAFVDLGDATVAHQLLHAHSRMKP